MNLYPQRDKKREKTENKNRMMPLKRDKKRDMCSSARTLQISTTYLQNVWVDARQGEERTGITCHRSQ